VAGSGCEGDESSIKLACSHGLKKGENVIERTEGTEGPRTGRGQGRKVLAVSPLLQSRSEQITVLRVVSVSQGVAT